MSDQSPHQPKPDRSAHIVPTVPRWIFTACDGNARRIAVLAKLWSHRNTKLPPPAVVWPSRAEIHECVRLNGDTLDAVLRWLEQAGWIARKGFWKEGRKHTRFTLFTPATNTRKRGEIVEGYPGSEGRSSPESEGLSSPGTEGLGSEPGSEKEKLPPIYIPDAEESRALQDAERIFAAYPRKEAKSAGIGAILRALESTPADVLLRATAAYASAVAKWPRDQRKFIPHPATWYSRGSYEDDPTSWQRTEANTLLTIADHEKGF